MRFNLIFLIAYCSASDSAFRRPYCRPG